jgi:hypothetical protein
LEGVFGVFGTWVTWTRGALAVLLDAGFRVQPASAARPSPSSADRIIRLTRVLE